MSITGVRVPLVGEDGNAFSIIGRVVRAMRNAGVDNEIVARYRDEVTSGDYNNLLSVTMCYVDDGKEDREANARRWLAHKAARDAGDNQDDIDAEDNDYQDEDNDYEEEEDDYYDERE